jgi:hypothetical protein
VVARIVGFLEGPVTGFIKGVSAQAGPWARVSLRFCRVESGGWEYWTSIEPPCSLRRPDHVDDESRSAAIRSRRN